MIPALTVLRDVPVMCVLPDKSWAGSGCTVLTRQHHWSSYCLDERRTWRPDNQSRLGHYHTSHIQDYKITSLTLHSLVKPLMERVVHLFGIMFYHLARSKKMRSEPPKMPRLEQPGHVATPAIGYSRHGNFSGSGFRHVYDVFIMSFDCRVWWKASPRA